MDGKKSKSGYNSRLCIVVYWKISKSIMIFSSMAYYDIFVKMTSHKVVRMSVINK